MPIKLFVKRASEADAPAEYQFTEEVVSIGRDGANRLILPDITRVVSKQHAEVRLEGGRPHLVDLGSKNYTYLNGDRIPAHEPQPLQDGDTIRIGEFELQLQEAEPASSLDDAGDLTVFPDDFVNDFKEDIERLVEVLQSLAETFEKELSPRRRSEAMHDAFDVAGRPSLPPEAQAMLAQELGWTLSAAQPEIPSEGSTVPRGVNEATSPAATPARGTWQPERDEAAALQVLDMLLKAVAHLVLIPSQFRYEFIGHTIVQPPDEAILFSGQAGALRDHLLDGSLSREERAERIKALDGALLDLVAHQIAILEGYKASVREGTRQLAEALTPTQLLKEISESRSVYRFLPALAKLETFDRLQDRIEELAEGDWSVAERRIFRPAFIRAYLARAAASASSSVTDI